MDVYLSRTWGDSREDLPFPRRTREGSLDPIELQGTPLIAEIQKVIDLPAREKADPCVRISTSRTVGLPPNVSP